MLTRFQIKENSKRQISGNIGIYFLCNLIYSAILIGFLALMYLPIFLNPLFVIFLTPLISAVFTLTVPAFLMSFKKIGLSFTRNEKIKAGDIFSGFQNYGKVLWLCIITSFFIFMWSLLFYIPGIVKSYAYSLAPYILAENPNMTAREALRESKRLTYGHKGDLFVLDLSFIGWHLLSPLTLNILNIWLVPYIEATWANYYVEIKKAKSQVPQENQPMIGGNNASINQLQWQPREIPDNVIDEEEQLTSAFYREESNEVKSVAKHKSASIICLLGDYKGAEFPIGNGEQIVIGRNSSVCNIVIDRSIIEVSGIHVTIRYDEEKECFIVIDSSTNGTFVDGKKLTRDKPQCVQSGSVILIANGKAQFLLK